MIKKDTALLLIDIQKGLDEWDYYGGNRNNPAAESNAGKVLNYFREKQLPIFHIQHSSANSSSPLHATKSGFEIKDEVRPTAKELVFTKNVNSAFIGTDLEKTLNHLNILNLIVVGLTTNHCVSTSVRMASNLGYKVTLISDACATFDMVGVNGTKYTAELMHQTALASLKDEFALIVTTHELLSS